MSTEPSKFIGTKLFFQMNHALICGTLLPAFVLDAMPVNAAFQIALSNDIVAEHRKLWSGMRFRIMDNPVFYELRVISITGTFVKCFTLKSFSSFKASLELSFSRIMHGHIFKDCSRLFGSTRATSSLACLFAGYINY